MSALKLVLWGLLAILGGVSLVFVLGRSSDSSMTIGPARVCELNKKRIRRHDMLGRSLVGTNRANPSIGWRFLRSCLLLKSRFSLGEK